MKKLLFSILLVLFSFTSIAQIEVKEGSFRKIEGYVETDKHKDINDRPMALIKISTENINAEKRRKFTFKGNGATEFDSQYKPGEIYLYLSISADFIEIIHDDYGKTEFDLPYDLCAYCAYEMVIQYRKQSAILVINTEPSGADIYIDGQYVGKSVKLIKDIEPGRHKLKLEKEGYPVIMKDIIVEEGETLLTEKLLNSKEIKISTTAEGDKIYIDGKYAGKSPVETRLSYGTHKVELERENKRVSKSITVDDQTDSFMLAIGKVVDIKSTHEGDKVFINGEKVGKTPLSIDLSLGTYNVKVKRGRKYDRQTISLSSYSSNKYNFYPKKNKTHYFWSSIGDAFGDVGYWLGDLELIDFFTIDGAYSRAPQTSLGLTFGSLDIGWYASVMTNFDFIGFETYKGYEQATLTGNSRYTRLSVTAGIIRTNWDDVWCFKIGAGYGMRMRCLETSDGNYVKYKPNSYIGVDITTGVQLLLGRFTLCTDLITTNFNMYEIKLGIGYNWYN